LPPRRRRAAAELRGGVPGAQRRGRCAEPAQGAAVAVGRHAAAPGA
jgi:hypothetical protein